MALYDRDYIRDGSSRSGNRAFGQARGLSAWSVNTWLIVICVAVFLIDAFTPTRFWKPVEIYHQLPAAVSLQWGRTPQYQAVQIDDERQLMFRRAVVDVSSNPPEPKGYIQYQYMPPLQRWLHFSTELMFFQGVQFWRLIGFQFLHADSTHLLFNMIGLFFFGPIVEQYLGRKRYLAFYLLCGIFGALTYLLLNLTGFVMTLLLGEGVRIPGLLFSSTTTPLVGASAGIFGVLMAGAYLAPRAQVLLFFILPMSLRTLAYALVAVAFLTVLFGGNNAGGEAGHLGGALAGFYFIRRSHHLHGFFDFLGRADPTSHHYRKPVRQASNAQAGEISAEVDRILDKVKALGSQSLTDHERQILGEASRRGRA